MQTVFVWQVEQLFSLFYGTHFYQVMPKVRRFQQFFSSELPPILAFQLLTQLSKIL